MANRLLVLCFVILAVKGDPPMNLCASCGSWTSGDGPNGDDCRKAGGYAHCWVDCGSNYCGIRSPDWQKKSCTYPSNIADVIGGNGFIQLGEFRLGWYDDNHFSIGAGAKTSMIFTSDGNKHSGNGQRTDFNLWNRPLTDGGPTNVFFTENGIQFKDKWCLGLSGISGGNSHLSIAHKNGNTNEIWRSDGTAHEGNGVRTDFNCWSTNIKNVVSVSADQTYVQFNDDFRVGKTADNHISVAASVACVIYSADGKDHNGPRSDYVWSWRRENTESCFTQSSYAKSIGYNMNDDMQFRTETGHNNGGYTDILLFGGVIGMIVILWVICLSQKILKMHMDDVDRGEYSINN